MSIAIALLFSLALMACSLITGPITILISFIAIRGLGQGSLGLVNSTAVGQWFQRRRGRVMGFSLVAFALFQRFYLPWMQAFIETHGWRAAWLFVGVVMAVVVLPLLGIFLRDRPEDFGLIPDGKPKQVANGDSVLLEENWQLAQALRTPIFWAFTFGRMLAGAWGTALIFHQVSIFEGLGYDAHAAANTYGQIALMTAAFTLVSGWLVDRLRPGYLITLQMVAFIAASLMAQVMTDPGLLLLYTVGFGIFMGVGSVFDSSVWVSLFGRQHQGAIRGFVAMTTVTGTAIGPLVFGLAFDNSGSYTPALWLGIGLAVIAIVLALTAKKPIKPADVVVVV
jgi:MFS family permease